MLVGRGEKKSIALGAGREPQSALYVPRSKSVTALGREKRERRTGDKLDKICKAFEPRPWDHEMGGVKTTPKREKGEKPTAGQERAGPGER